MFTLPVVYIDIKIKNVKCLVKTEGTFSKVFNWKQ